MQSSYLNFAMCQKTICVESLFFLQAFLFHPILIFTDGNRL